MFILRFLLVVGFLAAASLGALYALGALVVPEQQEVRVHVPMPKAGTPKG